MAAGPGLGVAAGGDPGGVEPGPPALGPVEHDGPAAEGPGAREGDRLGGDLHRVGEHPPDRLAPHALEAGRRGHRVAERPRQRRERGGPVQAAEEAGPPLHARPPLPHQRRGLGDAHGVGEGLHAGADRLGHPALDEQLHEGDVVRVQLHHRLAVGHLPVADARGQELGGGLLQLHHLDQPGPPRDRALPEPAGGGDPDGEARPAQGLGGLEVVDGGVPADQADAEQGPVREVPSRRGPRRGRAEGHGPPGGVERDAEARLAPGGRGGGRREERRRQERARAEEAERRPHAAPPRGVPAGAAGAKASGASGGSGGGVGSGRSRGSAGGGPGSPPPGPAGRPAGRPGRGGPSPRRTRLRRW